MTKLKQFILNLIYSLLAIVNILLRSRFNNRRLKDVASRNTVQNCIVMGNGPSLNESLQSLQLLSPSEETKIVCVNDFSCSEHFQIVRPAYYVFADPTYWKDELLDYLSRQREETFSSIINKTTWDMILFFPSDAMNSAITERFVENKHISICYYNSTPARGVRALSHILYYHNLAMPSPQNVLVCGIYLALNLGFKQIYVIGADHSWHESIVVGDDNVLYLRGFARFFEKDVQSAMVPVTHGDGKPWKLHDLFNALATTFESYHYLRDYSVYLNSKIYNASIKTYIDAFARYNINSK